MRIAVSGDGAGRAMARQLAEYLNAQGGLRADDLSDAPASPEEFYADLAERVVSGVLDGRHDRAILVCGTGIGVAMSANKVPGIRAAQCHDTYSAERAALSNNAQVLTLGARVVGIELAKAICDTYLRASFDPQGRSAANVAAVDALDARHHAERRQTASRN